MIYLVSYPHSGNTWVRYCFEYLTQLPTHGHRKFSISERNNNFLDVDLNKDPILIKRHTLEDIKKSDIFVLLLRDPSECIKYDQDVNKEFIKYYSLIKGYELSTNGGVIYYKWIFNKEYFKNIINNFYFFKNIVDQNKLDLLINNWEFHLKECRNIYNNKTHKTGADLSEIPEILLNHELIQNASN